MNEDKKKERLAALFGLEAPTETTAQVKNERESASREAEGALAYYENPKAFVEKMCTYCERRYAVNRANTAYCSDSCRSKALADIGIEWDASKNPTERWALFQGSVKTAEPLTVPPEALNLLKPLVENREAMLQEVAQQQEEVPPWEAVLAELE